jgi:CheY-like chemotaxis protein
MGRTFEPCRQVVASRILIVDDEEYIRDVMAMILDGLGYGVTATGDGFEALRGLETEPYDLVISDLRMPGLDGPALYKEILARWPTGGHVTVDDLRGTVGRVLTPV